MSAYLIKYHSEPEPTRAVYLLNWTQFPATVREDQSRVDDQCDHQEGQGEVGPAGHVVPAPDVADHGLEELEHHHAEDDEVDGQSVDLVVDLAGPVHPGEVVLVHAVLQYEVEQPWARRKTIINLIVGWSLPNGVMSGQLKLYIVIMASINSILA